MNPVRSLLILLLATVVVGCEGVPLISRNAQRTSSAASGTAMPATTAATTTPPHAAASAPSTGAVQLPCAYPDRVEIAALTQSSDAVVEATVVAATVTPPDADTITYTWTYPLRAVTVLALRPGIPTPPSVPESGSATLGLLPPGRTILFLTWNGGTFYAAGGMAGVFPVTASGRVERLCVDYADPARPRPAVGSSLTESAFWSVIAAASMPGPSN